MMLVEPIRAEIVTNQEGAGLAVEKDAKVHSERSLAGSPGNVLQIFAQGIARGFSMPERDGQLAEPVLSGGGGWQQAG